MAERLIASGQCPDPQGRHVVLRHVALTVLACPSGSLEFESFELCSRVQGRHVAPRHVASTGPAFIGAATPPQSPRGGMPTRPFPQRIPTSATCRSVFARPQYRVSTAAPSQSPRGVLPTRRFSHGNPMSGTCRCVTGTCSCTSALSAAAPSRSARGGLPTRRFSSELHTGWHAMCPRRVAGSLGSIRVGTSPSSYVSPSGHATSQRRSQRSQPPASISQASADPKEDTDVDSIVVEPESDPLEAEYALSEEAMLQFDRNGHVETRGLLPSPFVYSLRPHLVKAFEKRELDALRQKIRVLAGEKALRSTSSAAQCRAILAGFPRESIPFLQVFNLWRTDPRVREIAFSPLLGRVAAQLLGVRRVRLYQDSLFVKRFGDGPTNWHSDLNMAPFDTNDFVTVWIPLQHIPAPKNGGTGLMFASRSHRDFALAYWRDPHVRDDLSGRYRIEAPGVLQLGDATWHHGWVLHMAEGNQSKRVRLALAISFVADGVRRLGKGAKFSPDDEDMCSYREWINDVGPGSIINHPLVPLVYDDGKHSERPKPKETPT